MLLKPNGLRAQYATMMIWIMLGLEAAMFVSNYFQLSLLQEVQAGEFISEEAARTNDIRVMLLAVIHSLAYLGTAVVFIMWFRRAYRNLHLLVDFLSFKEGWAAGAWFVPILNLFRPYQIMKELYDETATWFEFHKKEVPHVLFSSWIGWWWALWILNNFVGNIDFRLSLRAETIDELVYAVQFSMFGNAIFLPLCLLAVKVIRDYSGVEPLLTLSVQTVNEQEHEQVETFPGIEQHPEIVPITEAE